MVFLSYFPDLALGGQKTLLHLVDALHGGAFEARVVVPADGPMATAMEARGVPVFRIPIRYPVGELRGEALRAALALSRVLARGCDVVYVDGPDHVLPAATAALGRAARVVWHVQMSLPSELDEENLGLVDGMVLCSPAIAPRFGGVDVPVRVVPNGVDTTRFSPAGPRAELDLGGRPLVLCVGELSERKGTFDLVAAMAALGPRAVLGVVGRGSPEVEARLAETIAGAGLSDRVRLLGYRDDVPALLRSADVVVLPSHSEGMSLALLEAMATGVPVVVSDIPANRAVLDGGRPARRGLCVPVGDARALAAGIATVLEDRDLARELGAAARRHVVAHHDRSVFNRAFGEALADLTAAPRRPLVVRAYRLAAAWRRSAVAARDMR